MPGSAASTAQPYIGIPAALAPFNNIIGSNVKFIEIKVYRLENDCRSFAVEGVI